MQLYLCSASAGKCPNARSKASVTNFELNWPPFKRRKHVSPNWILVRRRSLVSFVEINSSFQIDKF